VWGGQSCDVCAKLVARTRQSGHISRRTSDSSYSLILRSRISPLATTSSQSPTLSCPLAHPPCQSLGRSLSLSVRLSPSFPLVSVPVPAACYLASTLVISIIRSATVCRYTESASRRKRRVSPMEMNATENNRKRGTRCEFDGAFCYRVSSAFRW
jgi:hypothetical protein